MLKRIITGCLILLVSMVAAAQTKTIQRSLQTDSVRLARKIAEKKAQDSVKHIQDSLQMQWVKFPDAGRANLFLDSLRKVLLIQDGNVLSWALKTRKSQEEYAHGQLKVTRDRWVLLVIGGLFLFFAILKQAFGKEVYTIAEAFFSNRTLGQINKEDNLFTSWAFVFLYVLFGFTIGMFMYLAGTYYAANNENTSIQGYLTYTLLVLMLFTLKIVITRLIGFIFGIQRLVREYVSILYLSYFNAALLFLPLVLILSLVPQQQMHTYLFVALLLFALMLIFQLLRAANSILNTYRFSKFYLFIYLCTLEIGPVLVLIKVLDI